MIVYLMVLLIMDGPFHGVILDRFENSWIQFNVYKNVRIYSYSHKYANYESSTIGYANLLYLGKDGNFASMGNTANYNLTGVKTLLVTLPRGTYRLQSPLGYYANWDEWEVELVK